MVEAPPTPRRPRWTPVSRETVLVSLIVYGLYAVAMAFLVRPAPPGEPRRILFLPAPLVEGFLLETFLDLFAVPTFWYLMLAVGGGLALLGLGSLLVAPRERSDGPWLPAASLGLALAGDGCFSLEIHHAASVLWLVAIPLMLLGVVLLPREQRELQGATTRQVFWPLLLGGLLIAPVLLTHADRFPRGWQPWNYQMASTLMHALDFPQETQPDWILSEGTIIVSRSSPIHYALYRWWTDWAGLTKISLEALPKLFLLLLVPWMYWWLEGTIGRLGATVATLAFAWQGFMNLVFRNLSTIPSSLVQQTLFVGALVWCHRGRSLLRWVVLGIIGAIGFFVYAPSRLMLVTLVVVTLWECIATPERRWWRLGGSLVALLVSTAFLIPTFLEWPTFRQRSNQFANEHYFARSNRADFFQHMYGLEVSSPPTLEERATGLLYNVHNNYIRQGWRKIFPRERLWDHWGIAFIGIAAAVAAWGAAWRRWLLAWLATAAIGPVVAVFIYNYRFAAFYPVFAVTLAVPFALAWQIRGTKGRRAEAALRVLVAVGAVLVLANILQGSLRRVRYNLGDEHYLLAFLRDNPDLERPLYLVHPGTNHPHSTMSLALFPEQRAMTEPVFTFVRPADAPAFATDLQKWGFPGTVVGRKSVMERVPWSGTNLSFLNVDRSDNRAHTATLGPQADDWTTRRIPAVNAAQMNGIYAPLDGAFLPEIVLWGRGRWIVPRKGPTSVSVYEIPVPETPTGVADVVLRLIYRSKGDPTHGLGTVKIGVGGFPHTYWRPDLTRSQWTLSEALYLGSHEAGPLRVALEYINPGSDIDHLAIEYLWVSTRNAVAP